MLSRKPHNSVPALLWEEPFSLLSIPSMWLRNPVRIHARMPFSPASLRRTGERKRRESKKGNGSEKIVRVQCRDGQPLTDLWLLPLSSGYCRFRPAHTSLEWLWQGLCRIFFVWIVVQQSLKSPLLRIYPHPWMAILLSLPGAVIVMAGMSLATQMTSTQRPSTPFPCLFRGSV